MPGGPFSIRSKGKLSKGKSWGKPLRRQDRQISVCHNHTLRLRQMLCGAGFPACYSLDKTKKCVGGRVLGVYYHSLGLTSAATRVKTEASMLLLSYHLSISVSK